MAWRGDSSILERVYAGLPYLLPLAGASIFGLLLYQQVPWLLELFRPFLYLKAFIQRGILPGPLGDLSLEFFVWLGLFIFVVRNHRLKHLIRFNAMQALMIDIAMALVQGITELFSLTILPPARNLLSGLAIAQDSDQNGVLFLLFATIFSTVFFAATAMALYSIFQTARGKYGEIPIISDAAYNMTRY
ncbi:MAG: Tic20 family protein [Pseudanabaenaceae cyanobacterium bins.68]|nr:Tic20 family protein [Pseudanabaenaceae cyanobacterium bins.68]